MTATITKVKVFAEKVQDKINDQINSLDHYLADKSILSKEGISDGKLVGRKECSLEEFYSVFKNVKKNGIMIPCSGSLRFTPAHGIFDFKIGHAIEVSMLYSKKRHITYVYLRDDGYLRLSNILPMSNNIMGTVLKFDGLVTYNDLIGDRYDKVMTKIFTELYDTKDGYYKDNSEEESYV